MFRNKVVIAWGNRLYETFSVGKNRYLSVVLILKI